MYQVQHSTDLILANISSVGCRANYINFYWNRNAWTPSNRHIVFELMVVFTLTNYTGGGLVWVMGEAKLNGTTLVGGIAWVMGETWCWFWLESPVSKLYKQQHCDVVTLSRYKAVILRNTHNMRETTTRSPVYMMSQRHCITYKLQSIQLARYTKNIHIVEVHRGTAVR